MARSPHHPSLGGDALTPMIRDVGHVVLHCGHACPTPGCCPPPALVPWSYTVGLTHLGRAELVVLGLDLETSHALLTTLAATAAPDVPFDTGFRVVDRLVKLVPAPDDWVLTDPERLRGWFSHRISTPQWPALPSVVQVVWAGSDGRFPDDAGGVAEASVRQPMLRDHPFSLPLALPRSARRAGGRHRRAA